MIQRNAALLLTMQRRQTAAKQSISSPQTKRKLESRNPSLTTGREGPLTGQRRDSILADVDHHAPKTKDNPTTSRPPGTPVISRACACLDCRPDLYLQTTHAHELQRFQRTTHQLGLFQHDSLQLAELAIASFDGSDGYGHYSETRDKKAVEKAKGPGLLAFAQHHAIRKWKQWLHDPEAQAWRKAQDLSKYDPNSILHTSIAVFNELFFLGQLPNPSNGCEKGVLDIQWSPPGTSRRAYSHVVSASNDSGVQNLIWINPHHPSHFLNPKGLLDTLLHELCHIFLQRFSCYNGGGEGCDRNQVCVELCQENYGSTGHGRAWQRLAAAIEEAAPRLLDGLRVDLGRDEGAVREMERLGAGWWPTECDMETFDQDFRWSLRALVRSRDDDRGIVERVRSWVLKGRLCPRQRPWWMRRRKSI